MNNKEFERMAVALRPRLTALCGRFLADTNVAEEAEDLVQDTLLRLWGMRERMESYKSVEALAVMVAKNACIDSLRRSRPKTPLATGMAVAATEETDDALLAGDTKKAVDRAFARLTPTKQNLLRWRSEGFELDEIATMCNMTKPSVKTLISAARRELLKQMKE